MRNYWLKVDSLDIRQSSINGWNVHLKGQELDSDHQPIAERHLIDVWDSINRFSLGHHSSLRVPSDFSGLSLLVQNSVIAVYVAGKDDKFAGTVPGVRRYVFDRDQYYPGGGHSVVVMEIQGEGASTKFINAEDMVMARLTGKI